MKDVLFEMICSVCAAVIESLKAEGNNQGLLCKKAEYLVAAATLTYIEISHEFEGERVYISRKPRGRDQEIRGAFRGNNVDEVAKTFGVNRATVYRAIKRQKREPEQDIVKMIVAGVIQRKTNPVPKKFDRRAAELMYEEFAASETFCPYLKVEK